jgi:two-component system cell cycle response regulator DivK
MEQSDAASPTVMVVEDFDDTRQMMRRFLEMGGCRVVEAVNGREAIELAQREHPALILMDLNMPVLDGFTATLRIRENEQMRDVPIVAVTAYDTAEFRAAANAVGCSEYVAKPVDFGQLMTLLNRLLFKGRAQANGEAAR